MSEESTNYLTSTCIDCNEQFINKNSRVTRCPGCKGIASKERGRKYYLTNKEMLSMKAKKRYADNPDPSKLRAERRRISNGITAAKPTSLEEQVLEIILKYFKINVIRTKCTDIIKNPNGRYLELDFYIPDIKVAIELDGPIHRVPIHGDARLARQITNDKIKDNICKSLGINLIRIPLESGVHYDRPGGKVKLEDLIIEHLSTFIEVIA